MEYKRSACISSGNARRAERTVNDMVDFLKSSVRNVENIVSRPGRVSTELLVISAITEVMTLSELNSLRERTFRIPFLFFMKPRPYSRSKTLLSGPVHAPVSTVLAARKEVCSTSFQSK